MEALLALRIAALLIGTGLAAAQDAKTGLISDKITYAMIALGTILNLIALDFTGLALGAIVFATGYIVYYFGKIGGGDVKLFTGIAFLMPFFAGKIFVISTLFFSAIFAVIFYSVYFTLKYLRKGMGWKENKQGIRKALFFAIIVAAYFVLIVQTGIVAIHITLLLGIAFALGTVFMAFEAGIRKNFFLKKIPLKALEEDEIIASDFLDEKTKKILELKIKGVLGEEEKTRLEKAGIKEILVYRNLPPFAPFIFLATIIVLWKPDLLTFLFI